CRCIWLRASAQEHMARVLAQGDTRPFRDRNGRGTGRSSALDEIRKLLADRERLYGRAGAVIDTSGKSVRQVPAELKRAVALSTSKPAPIATTIGSSPSTGRSQRWRSTSRRTRASRPATS